MESLYRPAFLKSLDLTFLSGFCKILREGFFLLTFLRAFIFGVFFLRFLGFFRVFVGAL